MSGVEAHNAHRSRRTAEGAENYAKAIYQLQGRGEDAVGTGAVAERIGVTPASASAMLKRLADDGLVEHVPYHGVRLTSEGEQLALEVIRHHRLIELFLAEVLGMPWDRVHDEAEVLEHHISEELEELIASKLGQPLRDPHGDPIPSRELDLAADDSVRLSELEAGQSGRFERVSDRDAEMLRYLDERGIHPGVELEVSRREPFAGPMLVEVGGVTHALGGELIERMRVSGVSSGG
ncbi:MAG TPA: metal-dependent transcriptional regulator [Solirubrobacterales bacterium]|jgi:DtxR family Mn-dependent transcriptional regulator|nr:metal-dependent transcriptional regulator [Solirubrobacterales bacterium]